MGLAHNIKRIFTWWDGQSFGTQLWTSRNGTKVGEDDQGNIFYQNADASRRWVIYNGYAEASAIPPGWHGWMHHRTDTPPSQESYEPREWQLPHKQNLTGTARAYRPQGSIYTTESRPVVTGDYDAWSPGD